MVNGPQSTGGRKSTSSSSDGSEKPKDFFLFETNSDAMKIQDKKELISGNIGQKQLIQLI